MREEENLNGRRQDCDFVNISAGFGSQAIPTLSRTRCAKGETHVYRGIILTHRLL